MGGNLGQRLRLVPDASDDGTEARLRAPSQAPMVYVGFFWADRTQQVEFQVASLQMREVTAAACDYLAELDVPEEGFKGFLLTRVRAWDGGEAHTTTVMGGKLVMTATPLVSHLSVASG